MDTVSTNKWKFDKKNLNKGNRDQGLSTLFYLIELTIWIGFAIMQIEHAHVSDYPNICGFVRI